jgi:hypothetical protein
MEINLSPKHSSLAYDELNDQIHDEQMDVNLELNLIITKPSLNRMNSSPRIIQVGGRVTVSF